MSIEEVAELAIARDEWIQLETRPSGGRGGADVDLGALLETALRLGRIGSWSARCAAAKRWRS